MVPRSVGVVLCVNLNKRFQIVRQVLDSEDRIRGADRNAGAAIDAACRIHIDLLFFLKTGLIFFGMDAVGRANICAEQVLDALVGNHICHVALLDDASSGYSSNAAITVTGVTTWMCSETN